MNRNSITLFCFFISFVLFNNCILTRPTDQNVPESKQIQISPENSSTTGSFHTLSNSSENDKKIESKKKVRFADSFRVNAESSQSHDSCNKKRSKKGNRVKNILITVLNCWNWCPGFCYSVASNAVRNAKHRNDHSD